MELRLLASTDHLTGAFDRRAFRKAAEHDIALARVANRPLSLILFDVDHFKQVNDTYGHGVGDAVLKNLVATCQAALDVNACLGRLGGEEFAVVLPGRDLAQGLAVAERLRLAVDRLVTSSEGASACVTISLGVTTLMQGAQTLDKLLAQADGALYDAKASGRNCSRSAPASRTPEVSVG